MTNHIEVLTNKSINCKRVRHIRGIVKDRQTYGRTAPSDGQSSLDAVGQVNYKSRNILYSKEDNKFELVLKPGKKIT